MLCPVTVVIPTLNGAGSLEALLTKLARQTLPPTECLIIDSSSRDETSTIAQVFGCRVVQIPRADFDHGKTRNLGVALAASETLVFMTQDAVPADEHFIERLTRPVMTGRVSAAYGRQRPHLDAPKTDTFLRAANYPRKSEVRDPDRCGIRSVRSIFFSNVASAIDRKAFYTVGGFPERVVVNEDMLLCAKLLNAGFKVSYVADAEVFHSHAYTIAGLLRRYFDIGVFMREHAATLGCTATTGDGCEFALNGLRHFVRERDYGVAVRWVTECAVRFAGYRLGQRHDLLPWRAKRFFSGNPAFWRHPSLASSENELACR